MRSLAQLLLTVLLNASWQIVVVTAFAACCSWLLRGTAAWCRHSVWVVALAISLCLPIISGLNALDFSPSPTPPKQNLTRIEPEQSVTGPAGVQEVDLAIAAVQIPIVQPAPQRGGSAPIRLSRNAAAALLAFYALILLYGGLKLLRAWRRTTAIMRSAYPTKVSGRAAATLAKCQTAIGVRRVRVVCSTSVPVPITAGVFNPLIILPARLLSEADEDVLLSAIGHELVHVARRDYILNLIYEFIYLPISFHPAAALFRRRIKQTRELCCDELVAKKLLAPQVYARSLVRLVGSVPLAGRLAPDTTIGITDADILEVRIMSLLTTSKLSKCRKTLLLIAACLLLSAPCVAAATFTLQFDIDNPEVGISQQQDQRREASQKLERAGEELQRARELQGKAGELEERARKNPNPQSAELETVRRMESELREASERFSHEQEAQHLNNAEQSLHQVYERLAQIMASYPADEARIREARKQLEQNLEQLQRSLPQNEEWSRQLREQFALIEKNYPNAAQMAEQLQSLRLAQEEMAQQKEVLKHELLKKIDEKVKHERRIQDVKQQYREALEKKLIEDREGKNKIKNKEYEKLIRKEMDKRRKELDEAARYGGGREEAELTQLATISMDRAIQIAVSRHPGKVLSCNLVRQKDGQAFYRLVIISGAGDKSAATHIWVSATDGRILKD